MTDAELVRQARQGEARALADLLGRWAPRALALCHVHANRQAAADLAQESLLRVIRHLGQLKNPDLFGARLRGIVKRVCYDWISSKRRVMIPFSALNKTDFDVHEVKEDTSDEQDQSALKDDLDDALAALPAPCREVVHLYYSSKITYQELGDILEVSTATINARLTQARALLRERLLPRLETRS